VIVHIDTGIATQGESFSIVGNFPASSAGSVPNQHLSGLIKAERMPCMDFDLREETASACFSLSNRVALGSFGGPFCFWAG